METNQSNNAPEATLRVLEWVMCRWDSSSGRRRCNYHASAWSEDLLLSPETETCCGTEVRSAGYRGANFRQGHGDGVGLCDGVNFSCGRGANVSRLFYLVS